MSPRSIRRAAERKANKLARKAARQLDHGQLDAPPAPAEISESRLAANRANAQFSTGPTSPAGKAKSSLNAVKTALTGRTVLLSTDDAAAYEQHVRNFETDLKPATPQESALVQSLADTAWRLDRIPGLEYAIFARGCIQFADQFKDYDPAQRASLIDLETFLAYEKQLRNLQIQEARLHRRRDKDMAELRRLQDERDRRERHAIAHAAKRSAKPQQERTPHTLPDLGFEFSTADIATLRERVLAANQQFEVPPSQPGNYETSQSADNAGQFAGEIPALVDGDPALAFETA